MTNGINPATKLPHTPAFLARGNAGAAQLLADWAHCTLKSKTRKRSVAALMRAKGYTQRATEGDVLAQWVKA